MVFCPIEQDWRVQSIDRFSADVLSNAMHSDDVF